jgi:asparagine synthase (glutamine-hydrolysing)
MLLRTQAVAAHLPAGTSTLWRGVRGLLPHIGPAKRAIHLVDYTVGGLGAFLQANPGVRDFRDRGLLGPRLLDHAMPEHPWSIQSARNALGDYLEHNRATQFVSEYLTKVDGASMYYGLEARSPFLGRELWEYASALPYGVRLHGGALKAVLRELARRHLGSRVADAPKQGFIIPVEEWMGRRWLSRVEETMRDSQLVAEGWMSASGVQAEVALARRSARASRRLWYLWVLEEWLRLERNGGRSSTSPGTGVARSPATEGQEAHAARRAS